MSKGPIKFNNQVEDINPKNLDEAIVIIKSLLAEKELAVQNASISNNIAIDLMVKQMKLPRSAIKALVEKKAEKNVAEVEAIKLVLTVLELAKSAVE